LQRTSGACISKLTLSETLGLERRIYCGSFWMVWLIETPNSTWNMSDPSDIYEVVQQVVHYEEAGRPSTYKKHVREVKTLQGNMETGVNPPRKPHAKKTNSTWNKSSQENCY
jgi:hypothetical protein